MSSANRSTQFEIEEWLKPVLEKENLKNYSVNVSGSTLKGDNFMGDVTFVQVIGKTSDNVDKTYNFVVKSGKKSKELRDIIPVRSAFENEIYFYNEVMPVLLDFQKEKNITDVFDNLPKCYAAGVLEDNEVLVMENMKLRGFGLHDRKEPMDVSHIKEIIKLYGKLHAISYALRDQKPDIFHKLTSQLSDIMKLINESISAKNEEVQIFDKIITLALEENDYQVVQKARELNKLTKSLNNITDPSDPFAVILHGDCWNNNFMFKYDDEENTRLSEVCILDLQLSRLASPVYDLSYFLFTSLSEDNIDKFDEIVDLYYESLSNFLRQLGSDPDKMFPYEELKRQWKRFGFLGLVLMPSIINICLAESDEVRDLAEVAESGVQLSKVFDKVVKNLTEYKKRTLPLIRLAVNKGII